MIKVSMFYLIAIKIYEGSKLLKMGIFANIEGLLENQRLEIFG
jgi:hypothetical protein